MPISGAKTIARNLTRYGGGFTQHVDKVMGKVSKIMDKAVTKNISLKDHSLKDLAQMGHPYAKRHGPEGSPIHDPYWLVHTQSGELLASKEAGVEGASIAFGKLKSAAYVKFDENKAPHAWNVVYGTSRMIPRPVLLLSVDDIKDEAFKLIHRDLKHLTVNFKSL